MGHTILVNDWELNEDGKYYVHIPFECNEEDDTIIEFTDTDEYIQEHKDDFDSLNNGESTGTECIISADKLPNCEMKVEIKTVDDAGGRVVYDKKGNPEYLPPDNGGFGAFAGMLGGMNIPTDVIENAVQDAKEIIQDEKKEEE